MTEQNRDATRNEEAAQKARGRFVIVTVSGLYAREPFCEEPFTSDPELAMRYATREAAESELFHGDESVVELPN
jgi:hypothetical protein